ncbi:copper resistance CopC/CopD family protein [Microvirga yunnanensis]|uniref:copper resistance CopC/CopD family protein n=1 Tax=Microvirga yunnanensis TaxID=2953740 RepID=UPI0021C67CD5|nr:CopD family protein [Microvirga sp. HBU65207]
MKHALLLMLWLTLAILGGRESALAHAALVEAHPADGAVMEQAPAMVRLRFNEPVSLLVVTLTDARGRTHRDLAASASNGEIGIAMPPDLPRGSQILSYRVISGDGHPISGSVVFSLGAPTGSGAGPAAEGAPGVQPVLWLARVALYLGLFVGVGGAFFMAWVAPDLPIAKAERCLVGFLAIGAIAAVLSLGLQGVDALGEPLTVLARLAVWTAGWRTSFGPAAAAGVAAVLVAWLGLRGSPGSRWACSLAALAGVGLSLALSGHASAAAPQWATRPAVFLHGVGVAYWVGALIPLSLMVRQAPVRALPAIRRFSNGALVAVAVLTLTGLLLALIQVETPANLIATAYGQVLIAKLVLVAGLLGLAAVNRIWLTPSLAATDGPRGKWLVRSVAAEIVLATAILALVGLWRLTPPPRALAPATEAVASASVHLHTPTLMAQVTLLSGRASATRARIVVASGRAEPVRPKEVTLILAKPDVGIEPIARQAQNMGRDGWQVDGLVLPMAGPWQIRVEILINDFEKASLAGTLTIRP